MRSRQCRARRPRPCPSTGTGRRSRCRRARAPIGFSGTSAISRWARAAGRGGPSIAAIAYNSAPAPSTPLVVPGTYTVKLTANGQTQTQTMTVKQDPRVKTPALAIQQVYSLITATYFGATDARAAQERARGLREQIADRAAKANGAAKSALEAFDKKVETIAGAAAAGGGGGRGGAGGAAVGHPPPRGRRRWPARPARSAASSIRWARPMCRRRRIRSRRSQTHAPSARA